MVNSKDLILQARARIVWGEPLFSVRVLLISSGIPVSEADAAVDELMAERNSELRKRAIVKMCVGSMIVIGGLAFFMVSYGRVDLDRMDSSAQRAFAGTAVVIALGGLYGGAKLIDGIFHIGSTNEIRLTNRMHTNRRQAPKSRCPGIYERWIRSQRPSPGAAGDPNR